MAECHYFCAPITQVHPALQEIDCWRIALEQCTHTKVNILPGIKLFLSVLKAVHATLSENGFLVDGVVLAQH